MRSDRLAEMFLSLLAALLLVIILAPACSKPSPPPNSPQSLILEETPVSETYKIRLQHSWGAAENHFFEQYAAIASEMTGGKIDITVYSDGEIVPWDELSDAVATGMLDMGHAHPDYYGDIVPEGLLESAPYLWRTLDEEIAVIFEYGIGDIYKEALEERFGYHVIGFQPDDCGALMFTREINSLADMEGCVIQVMEPTASILAKLAGSSATYLSPEEIYDALATGAIDGAEYGGAKAMLDMGLHNIAKYLVLPRHQTAYFPFYFMNQELWNKLSPDLQAILREAVRANSIYMRSFYAGGEANAIEIMKDSGVKICYLPDEDVKAIYKESLMWLTEDYASISPRCKRAADICLEALKDFGRID